MDTKFKNLPIVDWEQNLHLAGNNKDLANDMLTLFTEHLPDELNLINQHHNKKNEVALLKAIHKLHGAVAYCGLPRLKIILNSLEVNLKNHKLDDIPALMKQLNEEAKLAMQECNDD